MCAASLAATNAAAVHIVGHDPALALAAAQSGAQPGRSAARAAGARPAPQFLHATPLLHCGPKALCTAHADQCTRAAEMACNQSPKFTLDALTNYATTIYALV